MMGLLRPLLALLAARMPGELRSRLLRPLGWQVDPSAKIGFSWVSVASLRLGPRARIGHLCVLERLEEVALAERAEIGRGTRVRGSERGEGSLRMGAAAAIAERHFLDAGAGVELGKYANLAGRGTQVWTHHRRRHHPESELERAPVRIGERAYVGSRAVLLPGVELAEGATVAAGAIVSAAAAAECRAGGLLAGNPAQVQADA